MCPLYDFICVEGHIHELRRGYDEGVAACPQCGDIAVRNPININQSIVTETGFKAGRRAPVPRDERNLRNEYRTFLDASGEVDHAYSKAEASVGHEINPRLWERGRQQARELKAKGVTAEEFAKRRAT